MALVMKDGRNMRSSETPCRASAGILTMTCLWAALALAGCGRSLRPGTEDAGPRNAVVISTSRMVTSPTKGPTIPVPGNLTDAMTLWGIPAEALKRETEPRIAQPDTFPNRWIPDDESSSMRRFLGLGNSGQARSRVMHDRMREHMPVIRGILGHMDIPLELAYLPAVESVFDPLAVSPSGAAGLWQLMPATAHRFGLRVDGGMDERFDIRKSTVAAANYLRDLHDMFGSWPLALAAYNCGEYALFRAMKTTGAKTLPDLIQACRRNEDGPALLSRETLDYVPKFVAAALALSGSGDTSAVFPLPMQREFRSTSIDADPVMLAAFKADARGDDDSPANDTCPD